MDVASPVNFTLPPVIEVAVGVQFAPVEGLGSYRSGSLYDLWKERYPSVSQLPEVPPWRPLADATPEQGVFIQLGVPSAARLWFATETGDFLIQLQANQVVVNWRRVGDRVYPRYPAIREHFVSAWQDVQAVVSGEDPLSVELVEVTYVNDEAQPPDVVLEGWANPLCSQGSGGFTATFEEPLQLPRTTRALRLTNVQGRYGEHPGTRLTLSVRAEPPKTGDPLLAIDAAREHIVGRFREVTSLDMHREWGDGT